MHIEKGSRLTVEIQGNRTTGYRWESNIGDGSVLSETGPPVFTLSSTTPGASGMYEFSYRAGASGETRLTLVYRRSWEAEVPPLRTFEVSVVVR